MNLPVEGRAKMLTQQGKAHWRCWQRVTWALRLRRRGHAWGVTRRGAEVQAAEMRSELRSKNKVYGVKLRQKSWTYGGQ